MRYQFTEFTDEQLIMIQLQASQYGRVWNLQLFTPNTVNDYICLSRIYFKGKKRSQRNNAQHDYIQWSSLGYSNRPLWCQHCIISESLPKCTSSKAFWPQNCVMPAKCSLAHKHLDPNVIRVWVVGHSSSQSERRMPFNSHDSSLTCPRDHVTWTRTWLKWPTQELNHIADADTK